VVVAQFDAMRLGLRPRQWLFVEYEAVGIIGRPVARDRYLCSEGWGGVGDGLNGGGDGGALELGSALGSELDVLG
jgi:hypothetical protein